MPAGELAEESLILGQAVRDTLVIALNTLTLGIVALRRGEYEQAHQYFGESLILSHKRGDKQSLAYCLEGFAGVAGARGDMLRAARLYSSAESLRAETGTPLPSSILPEREHSVAAVWSELGDVAFEAAREQGRAMAMEEAVAYALREVDAG